MAQSDRKWTVFVGWTIFMTLEIFAPRSQADAGHMITLGQFSIDRTEVTIGQFRSFADATGFISKAEKEGGGLVYEFGWERKEGWTWRTPYGIGASDAEPAVHLNFDEARAYCDWAGKRLPTEAEWILAAYTEQRVAPSPAFTRGVTYPYPTGDSPTGANCLRECGPSRPAKVSHLLDRGAGHAAVGTTAEGVNGLFDMGANVWEWVDIADEEDKGTRGGSWWYGARQMQSDYVARKPRDMAVVYIGFRCVK